jgi:hypothetical protein
MDINYVLRAHCLLGERGKVADDASGSPGNNMVIAGNANTGFFGEVSSHDLITGDVLSTELGLSSGSLHNYYEPYLKFSYYGKILFTPKKTFRHSLSWDYLNANGLVKGKNIIINGLTYKARLFRGTSVETPNAYEGVLNHNSEWNKLMLPIHEKTINKTWLYPNNVESDIATWKHQLGTGQDGMYTDADLGLEYGAGIRNWCQETSGTHSIARGHTDVARSGLYVPSETHSNMGWRPVLELVQ